MQCIFPFEIRNDYDSMIRPIDHKNGLTNVQIELKLLQIDLVS